MKLFPGFWLACFLKVSFAFAGPLTGIWRTEVPFSVPGEENMHLQLEFSEQGTLTAFPVRKTLGGVESLAGREMFRVAFEDSGSELTVVTTVFPDRLLRKTTPYSIESGVLHLEQLGVFVRVETPPPAPLKQRANPSFLDRLPYNGVQVVTRTTAVTMGGIAYLLAPTNAVAKAGVAVGPLFHYVLCETMFVLTGTAVVGMGTYLYERWSDKHFTPSGALKFAFKLSVAGGVCAAMLSRWGAGVSLIPLPF